MMILDKISNFFSKKTITAPIRNKLMMSWSSEENFYKQRREREKLRIKEDRKHVVYYFHSLSDPYSHLTIQVIKKLIANFNIELEIMFISEPTGSFTPERAMYQKHCLKDSIEIAFWYNLEFDNKDYFSKENERFAYKILDFFSYIKQDHYIDLIQKVSSLLWSDNSDGLMEIISGLSDEDKEALNGRNSEITDRGNKKIIDVEYYHSASFHYEGENYWGIDRIDHLENRLTELGLNKSLKSTSIIIKSEKPKIDINKFKEKKDLLNIDFFPSLNSPYTYISFKRVKNLIKDYPLNLSVRPVLPMLMRNMKIPTNKGKYILSDAAREGRKYDSIIKNIYSPIGLPALKAYSLFPIMDSHELGFRYLEQLTKASFFDGINIGNEKYLMNLSNSFGLSWDLIKEELNNDVWKKILEKNLTDMYKGNSWGVPTFKISNLDGSNPYYQWGQDRIWLIENEIIKRLVNHQ